MLQKIQVYIDQANSDVVRSVAFSPDGKTLVSGSRNKTIKLWDVATGKERVTPLPVSGASTVGLLASPFGQGPMLAGSPLYPGSAQATFSGLTGIVYSVAFSPDGKSLAAGSEDKTIKLWDVGTGKERTTLQGHTAEVLSVAFSPDGKTLASGSADKTIKLWDIPAGK
jgi:WD40 repeat protein